MLLVFGLGGGWLSTFRKRQWGVQREAALTLLLYEALDQIGIDDRNTSSEVRNRTSNASHVEEMSGSSRSTNYASGEHQWSTARSARSVGPCTHSVGLVVTSALTLWRAWWN